MTIDAADGDVPTLAVDASHLRLPAGVALGEALAVTVQDGNDALAWVGTTVACTGTDVTAAADAASATIHYYFRVCLGWHGSASGASPPGQCAPQCVGAGGVRQHAVAPGSRSGSGCCGPAAAVSVARVRASTGASGASPWRHHV